VRRLKEWSPLSRARQPSRRFGGMARAGAQLRVGQPRPFGARARLRCYFRTRADCGRLRESRMTESHSKVRSWALWAAADLREPPSSSLRRRREHLARVQELQ
jgi:hypothetical protein